MTGWRNIVCRNAADLTVVRPGNANICRIVTSWRCSARESDTWFEPVSIEAARKTVRPGRPRLADFFPQSPQYGSDPVKPAIAPTASRTKRGQAGQFTVRSPTTPVSFRRCWCEAGDFLSVLAVPDAQYAVFAACRHDCAVRRRRRTVNVVGTALKFANSAAVTGFVTENSFIAAAADKVVLHANKGQ